MALKFFLLSLLFLAVSADTKEKPKYCKFDQGRADLCRIDTKLAVRLPINAEQGFLARIENSDIVDPIPLQLAEIEQRRILPKADTVWGNLDCKMDEKDVDFVRFVDINDRNIRDGAWYVLCAEYDAVDATRKTLRDLAKSSEPSSEEDNEDEDFRRIFLHKPSSDRSAKPADNDNCVRCTLVRAPHEDINRSRFILSSWVKDRLSTSNVAVLRYTSGDFPFDSILISGRVFDLQERRQVYQFKEAIRPKQQLFIRVTEADNSGRYAVVTDLMPRNKNATQLLINGKPLIIQDYIRLESQGRNGPVASPNPGQQQNRHWIEWIFGPPGK